MSALLAVRVKEHTYTTISNAAPEVVDKSKFIIKHQHIDIARATVKIEEKRGVRK